jgi:putative ABC transport system permease protein
VRHASVVQQLALRSGGWNSGIVVEGKPDLPQTTTFVRLVAPEHFRTLGIAVKRGRGFQSTDVSSTPGDSLEASIVINEALAKKYFEGEDPIGRRVNSGMGPGLGRIVGVVDDVAEGALIGEAEPARYVLYESVGFVSAHQTFLFRTDEGRNPEALLQAESAAVKRGAPRAAISEPTTMERVFAHAVGPVRQIMTLVTLLTGVALLLCAIGVYGVISHFVARRQRDWGIRIALGLQPARVISGIVSRGAALVAFGSVIGLAMYAAQARFLTTFMYGVSPVDALSIVVSVMALLLVGVVAALLPAARASRTDPAIVLREQ